MHAGLTAGRDDGARCAWSRRSRSRRRCRASGARSSAASRDRLVPPEQVRDLWRHWEQPRIEWYPGSPPDDAACTAACGGSSMRRYAAPGSRIEPARLAATRRMSRAGQRVEDLARARARVSG